MKFKDVLEMREFGEANVKEFRNFYDLKCYLPGQVRQKYILVSKDLFPNGIYKVRAIPDNKKINFIISMHTNFGDYSVNSDINLETAEVTVSFAQEKIKITKSGKSISTFYVPKERFDKFILKYRSIVESFFDNLIKLRKIKSSSNGNNYKCKKCKNDKCDKLYDNLMNSNAKGKKD